MLCKDNEISTAAEEMLKCIHRTPRDLPLFSQVSDGGQNFHGQDPTSTEEQIQPSLRRTSLETRQA